MAFQPPQRADIPLRHGPRPLTTETTPHVQIDQLAPARIVGDLWDRMVGLRDVTTGPSRISAPSSRALHLAPELAHRDTAAYLAGTEFAHLHGDGSGSLHLTLPRERVVQVIAQGWGELHPVARAGLVPPTLVMLYGPRDQDDLATVWQLVEESYAYARGI